MSLIPFDDRDGTIWFNGEMIPWRDAKIHVINHGLHYASCIFEGERAYEGKIFKSHEHTTRLFKSASVLGMDIPFAPEVINMAKEAVLKANNFTNAYLRPVAWRGSEQMGIAARATRTHVAIAAWEWPSYFSPELRENGISLKTSSWQKPAPNTALTEAKAAGLYMINTLSKHQAEDEGYTDALMLDYRGYVAEATGANVFFVKDGVIHTPTPDCFLDGITRRSVMRLAKQRGYEVVERHIRPEEMAGFSECFIVGTAAEVTPVAEVGQYRFTPGQISLTLMDDYARLVRRELVDA